MRRWKPLVQIILVPAIALVVVLLLTQGRSLFSTISHNFFSAVSDSTPETATVSSKPTAECESYSADGEISVSATQVKVGETLLVTTTLRNLGECGSLGLPRYTLRLAPEGQQALTPNQPDPVTHSLGIGPGGANTAQFTLQALVPGTVELSFSVSFEAHLGYPGPATWGGSGAGPLIVEVVP